MNRFLFLTIILLFLFADSVASQSEDVKVTPYGFVSYEAIFDTYRSVETRDGEMYLFPKKPVFDDNGTDINDRNKLNMLSLQSRFGFRVDGPEVWGAKLNAILEADFFGVDQASSRLLRLRLAYLELKWENTELLAGNAFHPTFVMDCFPANISFAAAVPFHPLNRSPQIRITQNLSRNFSGSLSLLTHGYHRTPGPFDAQRNSGLPDSQIQFRFNNENFVLGTTAGYKFLSPRDSTNAGVATSKTIGSYNLQAFTRINIQNLTFKLQGLYGENFSHFIMIGGYGAKGTNTAENPFDWDADYDFANLRTFSTWVDMDYKQNDLSYGVFAGYTENLGSADAYVKIPGYSRFDEIHSLFRVSPRIVYGFQKFSAALEYSFYSAVYTFDFDENYKAVSTLDPVTNNHLIFQLKYVF
ncbi:MAG: hypothetical protein ACLFQS_00900 [Bacteroidales bacterium]